MNKAKFLPKILHTMVPIIISDGVLVLHQILTRQATTVATLLASLSSRLPPEWSTELFIRLSDFSNSTQTFLYISAIRDVSRSKNHTARLNRAAAPILSCNLCLSFFSHCCYTILTKSYWWRKILFQFTVQDAVRGREVEAVGTEAASYTTPTMREQWRVNIYMLFSPFYTAEDPCSRNGSSQSWTWVFP